MKAFYRITVLLLCLTAIITNGVVFRAEEEFDAFRIDDSEAAQYKFKFDDTAVKMYSGIFCYDFANGTDVYDIVKSSADKGAYIISSDSMIEIRYKENGSVVTAPISCLARSCLSQICVLAQNHGDYFDGETKVINTYIFHEMWGFSIYFVTNKGNFVMYKASIVSETIYLIPEDVYRHCAESMVGFINSTEDGTCPDYSYFADLSQYQIYPEKFPEIIPTPEGDPTPLPPQDSESTATASPETLPPKTPVRTESLDNSNDSSSDSATVSVFPIIIASAVPTVILGFIVIILLKRR
ncbi:MAG: hypothetical protein E7675_07875 [Ruminococcaceae bacterium]|nr:hypothetical protein [Oscillospiraceae bacterium]